MKRDWRGDKAVREVQEKAAKLVLAAAAELASEHQADLGKQYPPASRPGEFPARRTGNLQSAVSWEPQTVAGVIAKRFEVRVGYRRKADYIRWLAKRDRKWLIDTAKRILDRLLRRGVSVR